MPLKKNNIVLLFPEQFYLTLTLKNVPFLIQIMKTCSIFQVNMRIQGGFEQNEYMVLASPSSDTMSSVLCIVP